MTTKLFLTNKDINNLANQARIQIDELRKHQKTFEPFKKYKVYPVPRGGIPAAYALGSHMPVIVVDDPAEADIIFDDIIDSGTTREKYKKQYPNKPFLALINKQHIDDQLKYKGQWIVFPWEGKHEDDTGTIDDNIRRLLQFVEPDPYREGLHETPKRVAKAWEFWTKGYKEDPANVLKVFKDGSENYDEMITVKDIPFYSHCEHHMAPFFGTCTISYIPDGRIVGLSKLARLSDMYARRLQVQERLTSQISDAIMEHLNPKGVGVMVKARHMCMESRGTCKQGHHTITTSLRGVMKEAGPRMEFLKACE